MPDFGSPVSGANLASGLQAGTASTKTAVPGATAHTLGSWVDLGTPDRSGVLGFSVNWGQDTTVHRVVMFDLATGNAGAEQVILSDLAIVYSGSGITASRTHQQEIQIPILLPPNQLIRVRSRCSIASLAGVQVNLASVYNSPSAWTGSIVDTYGAVPASTGGTTMTSDTGDRIMGAYSTISAACDRIECFFVSVFARTAQTAFNNQSNFWELAVGPTGQEETIAAGLCAASSSDGITKPQFFGPFFQQISSGQRLSARCAKQWATTQRTLDMIVYGVR